MSFGLRVAVLGMCTALVSLPPAAAQKYPGDTLQSPPAYTPPPPVSPLPMPRAAPAPLPQPLPRPAPPFAPPPPPAAAITPEGDAQARQLANQLPLDPATRDLRNRLPPDVPGTIRQLGLHVPNGTRVDLRNRRPSSTEIVNDLAH